MNPHIRPDDLSEAENILLDAAAAIRRASGEHGHTSRSFTLIAEWWTTYITHVFTLRNSTKLLPQDVAAMMTMLKKARTVYGFSKDNYVDAAGYTSLEAMLTMDVEPKRTPMPPKRDFPTTGLKTTAAEVEEQLERLPKHNL